MPFHKFVGAGVCIVDGERAVRSGREHADALAVLEALKHNALHRPAGVKVYFLDGNVLFAGVRDGEERGVLAVVLNGERLFIEDITRVCYRLFRLIRPRLCVGQPDTSVFIGCIVAQQLAILPDFKGDALDRLARFLVDFVDTKMFLNGVLENQRGDLGLILDQLHGLLRRVQIVMLRIAVHLDNTVGAGLEVFQHGFAVLIGSYGSELGVVVVHIELPALQGDLGVLILLDDTDRQFLGVRYVDLADDLRGVCGGVYIDLMHELIF